MEKQSENSDLKRSTITEQNEGEKEDGSISEDDGILKTGPGSINKSDTKSNDKGNSKSNPSTEPGNGSKTDFAGKSGTVSGKKVKFKAESKGIEKSTRSENGERSPKLSTSESGLELSNETKSEDSENPDVKSRDDDASEDDGTSETESAIDEKSEPLAIPGEDTEYTFDDVMNHFGYGKFQQILTFLAGLIWLSTSFEIIILSTLGDFIACEWDIHKWQIAMSTTIGLLGTMVGAPCFGIISDNFGRKRALTISMLLLFFVGVSSAVTKSTQTMFVIICLMGFALGGVPQVIVLCVECWPAIDRGVTGFYLTFYWEFGSLLFLIFTWIVMELIGSWRSLLVVASIPSLAVVSIIRWYPESVRYYLVSGQYGKAVKQLEQMLSTNGEKVPSGRLKKISLEEQENRGNMLDLLKTPYTATTLLFWYIWIAIAFHYSALMLLTPIIIEMGKMSVSSKEVAHALGMNGTDPNEFFLGRVPCITYTQMEYGEYVWNKAAEVPVLIAYTVVVRYFPRKRLLSFCILLNTVVLLLLLIDMKSSYVAIALLFFARGNGLGIIHLVLIMTSEAYPTTLRATGVGSGSSFARLGAAMVPFAVQILVIREPLVTILLLSGTSFLCAIAASYLPWETKDVHLKDLTSQITDFPRIASQRDNSNGKTV